ncbi:DUF3817 domain-containing protein [Quadrisphaera sp. DSM 44207]|uniref:DUF3817 domain-containing protein n=1 Tax=Quadrisphaera sp. DSM 44207 TaxID=1881057 RepID=UPI00087E18A9|nr:DUF3817 domain-containing protein [Quadrisphaera sp. DSM 44207]SDQ33681.1 integral membrane protein [Quadrisphaera sp. DSM 44207]
MPGAFRVAALLEALTWAGLLVGTWAERVARTTEAGVELFGPPHGAASTACVALALVAARTLRWPARTMLLALAASVPPVATALFEAWARRAGRLAPPARAGGPSG